MKNLFKNLISGVILILFTNALYAQEGSLLTIGNTAPEIQYSKWLKGEPVQTLSGNQVYVLEFWATWCAPCKAAMPGLTKLQQEYKDKATIIGVNVFEGTTEEGKSYDSYLPVIEKFVTGNSKNMEYAVMVDNNDEFMANRWMKAAGLNGIPATFVVKNNKIIWIGHPSGLDTTLPKIMDGTYNMEAYKATFNKQSEATQKQMNQINTLVNPIQDAIKAKEYDKAFDLIDQAKKDAPMLAVSLDFLKFQTLVKEVNEQKAIEFAEGWQKEFKTARVYAVRLIGSTDSLKKSTYLWAANNLKNSDEKLEDNAVLQNSLAACFARGGDFKEALLWQQKAVAGAQKPGSTIPDHLVTEYEKALAAYQKGEMPVKD